MLADGKGEAELDELDIAIGMAEDPAEEARAALRAHQEATGMSFDDTPVQAVPDGGVPGWMTTDEEF